MQPSFLKRFTLGVCTVAMLAGSQATAFAQAHFNDANQLVTDLLSNNQNVNIYDGDSQYTDSIQWSGGPRTAITVCGTFMTLLIKHTYGTTNAQFTANTGSTSPNAAKYYDAIVAQTGFTRINGVAQLAQGDVISIKYPAGQNSSGHVMMVQSVGAWRPRQDSTQNFLFNNAEPAITGFYDITVMDSSASFHGPTDSRASNPGGIGRNGIFRIYVNNQFQILGYTWSTVNASEYKKVSSGYLVGMGRLNLASW